MSHSQSHHLYLRSLGGIKALTGKDALSVDRLLVHSVRHRLTSFPCLLDLDSTKCIYDVYIGM